MFKTYAQRLTPPYSGQIQTVETDTYRALTLDGQEWEVQYVNRIHVGVCTVTDSYLTTRKRNNGQGEDDVADQALGELFDFLADVQLPFASWDHLEYWLLDHEDKAPLALIYSCATEAQMVKFPANAEWTALPDSVMPIQKTDEELALKGPPINYRLESLVSKRAGTAKKASWFDRCDTNFVDFPPYLLREDWADPQNQDLCRRYIDRQAPRLMMLQGLSHLERQRLEACCEPHAMEVARFHQVYPEILDAEMVSALRVEARLRDVVGGTAVSKVQNRRDGIHYL